MSYAGYVIFGGSVAFVMAEVVGIYTTFSGAYHTLLAALGGGM